MLLAAWPSCKQQLKQLCFALCEMPFRKKGCLSMLTAQINLLSCPQAWQTVRSTCTLPDSIRLGQYYGIVMAVELYPEDILMPAAGVPCPCPARHGSRRVGEVSAADTDSAAARSHAGAAGRAGAALARAPMAEASACGPYQSAAPPITWC